MSPLDKSTLPISYLIFYIGIFENNRGSSKFSSSSSI